MMAINPTPPHPQKNLKNTKPPTKNPKSQKTPKPSPLNYFSLAASFSVLPSSFFSNCQDEIKKCIFPLYTLEKAALSSLIYMIHFMAHSCCIRNKLLPYLGRCQQLLCCGDSPGKAG